MAAPPTEHQVHWTCGSMVQWSSYLDDKLHGEAPMVVKPGDPPTEHTDHAEEIQLHLGIGRVGFGRHEPVLRDITFELTWTEVSTWTELGAVEPRSEGHQRQVMSLTNETPIQLPYLLFSVRRKSVDKCQYIQSKCWYLVVRSPQNTGHTAHQHGRKMQKLSH